MEYNNILLKGKPDRPLVNGKTGIELVKEWLEKYDVLQYIDEITSEKPKGMNIILMTKGLLLEIIGMLFYRKCYETNSQSYQLELVHKESKIRI